MGDGMKQLKSGDKILLTKEAKTAIDSVSKREDSARALATFAGELLQDANKQLFNTLEEFKPEVKGWVFTYDKPEGAIILRYKKE